MVDLVGGESVPTTVDASVHYVPEPHGRVEYRVTPQHRPVKIIRRSGKIRVEDSSLGISGEGPTYLDAIQALGRAVRERYGD